MAIGAVVWLEQGGDVHRGRAGGTVQLVLEAANQRAGLVMRLQLLVQQGKVVVPR